MYAAPAFLLGKKRPMGRFFFYTAKSFYNKVHKLAGDDDFLEDGFALKLLGGGFFCGGKAGSAFPGSGGVDFDGIVL